MTWGFVAVGGATVASGLIGANAAKDASAAATASTQQGIDFQRESRDIALSNQAPYRDAGYTALNALMDMSGLQRPASRTGNPEFLGGINQQNPADPGRSYEYSVGNKLLEGMGIDVPDLFGNVASKVFGRTKSKNRPLSQRTVDELLADIKANPDQYDDNEEFKAFMDAQRPGAKKQMYQAVQKAGLSVFANKPTSPVAGATGDEKYDWQKNNPGYDFRMQEGQKATENMLRSAGMMNSGKALRAITRYGQDYASNEFNNAFARLSSIAGLGPPAIASSNATLGNTANSIQQGYSQIGQANAYGQIGQANAWGGAITDAAGTFGDWMGSRRQGGGPSGGVPQNTTSVGGGGYRYGP